MQTNRKLVLENGNVYHGFAFGSNDTRTGEVVFTTGMTGYQESITDPSFNQQLLIFTYPLIGNYGINMHHFESIGHGVSGVIVGEYCQVPSHWNASQTLDGYLMEKNIPGISGLDTRALVKVIRKNGTLKGKICDSEENDEEVISILKNETFTGHVKNVSPKTAYIIPGKGKRIVVIDYGIKKSILQELADRNCDIVVMPYNVSAEQVLHYQPDGVLLSNGPGDPTELPESIATIKSLNGRVPIMGICLGHQLYALANGATTERLHFGHRGANHPVYDVQKDLVYLTSQNHSYAVNTKSLENTDLIATNIALNDKTIEGLKHKKYPAFTVQYHPEACAGPRDTNFLFDDFIQMINEFTNKEAK